VVVDDWDCLTNLGQSGNANYVETHSTEKIIWLSILLSSMKEFGRMNAKFVGIDSHKNIT
jgi:hypothetical protein